MGKTLKKRRPMWPATWSLVHLFVGGEESLNYAWVARDAYVGRSFLPGFHFYDSPDACFPIAVIPIFPEITQGLARPMHDRSVMTISKPSRNLRKRKLGHVSGKVADQVSSGAHFSSARDTFDLFDFHIELCRGCGQNPPKDLEVSSTACRTLEDS